MTKRRKPERYQVRTWSRRARLMGEAARTRELTDAETTTLLLFGQCASCPGHPTLRAATFRGWMECPDCGDWVCPVRAVHPAMDVQFSRRMPETAPA